MSRRSSRNNAALATGALALASATLFAVTASAPASAQTSNLVRGEKIVHTLCSRCHAVGKADASPNAKAPPFRDVGKNYPLEHLAEALAEGISTGAAEMPEFQFGPRDVDAIIEYLATMSTDGGH